MYFVLKLINKRLRVHKISIPSTRNIVYILYIRSYDLYISTYNNNHPENAMRTGVCIVVSTLSAHSAAHRIASCVTIEFKFQTATSSSEFVAIVSSPCQISNSHSLNNNNINND